MSVRFIVDDEDAERVEELLDSDLISYEEVFEDF